MKICIILYGQSSYVEAHLDRSKAEKALDSIRNKWTEYYKKRIPVHLTPDKYEDWLKSKVEFEVSSYSILEDEIGE